MARELRALQRRFFAMITGARCEPLGAWLAFDDDTRARERAQIYRDAYAVRLLDCLREDFPNVAALVGDAFDALVAEYVARHRPSHPSLRHLGERMPGFASEHALALRWPWLGELAALEWARVEAFDVANVAPLGIAELARVASDGDALASHVFATAPSVRVLRLRHPVHRVWRALEDGARAPTIDAERTEIVVWRRQLAVCHRVVDADEAEALRRVLHGARFADVCEALAGGSLDDAAARTLDAIMRWIADEMLVG
jgi:hypothetical protein